MLRRFYMGVVFAHAVPIVVLFLGVAAYLASYLPDFELSSGESALVLEGGSDKRVYDDTRHLFFSDDYVLVAVQPPDPWSVEGIELVAELSAELSALDGVERVYAPTNVPLFHCEKDPQPIPFVRFQKPPLLCGADGKLNPQVDLERAREHLTTSEVYSKQLISEDGSVFNLVAYFAPTGTAELEEELRGLRSANGDAPDDAGILDIAARVAESKEQDKIVHRRTVEAVREILPRYRERGVVVHASGLPTLTVDMIDYLAHDIRVFGFAVAGFMFLTLGLFFRRPRFVILPMLTCLVTVVAIMGLTVVRGVETTVVTSNLSSLLFIIGMAHSIHLVVKYREQRAKHPDQDYHEALFSAVHAIGRPCWYTAITTCVGFASLWITDIRPIKDFAVYMALGVVVAFVVSLVFLPACLALLKPTAESDAGMESAGRNRMLQWMAHVCLHHRGLVYGSVVVLGVISAFGIAQVRVDQRFIDYFREDTEVYQGLEFVDVVGGTMTVEVVLYGDGPDYWIQDENYERLVAIHEYCDGLEQTGKTLSLVSLREYARDLLDEVMPQIANGPVDKLVRFGRAQFGEERFRDAVGSVSTLDFSTVRVYVRLRESSERLDRIGLLRDLRTFLAEDPRLAPEWEKPPDMQPQVTGMFVLFTNMLSTLVGSQVNSFGWVFVAVVLMLTLLFRHFGVGFLVMPGNLLPVAMVLGTMGFAGITLDLMTVMIASISLGIAVDATIHYVVRFRAELRRTGDWDASIHPAHHSIGRAILFAALTVIAGFFVLILSKFTPTMYFGMLTGIAMVASLIADLLVLPSLMVTFRTFRKDAAPAQPSSAD